MSDAPDLSHTDFSNLSLPSDMFPDFSFTTAGPPAKSNTLPGHIMTFMLVGGAAVALLALLPDKRSR